MKQLLVFAGFGEKLCNTSLKDGDSEQKNKETVHLPNKEIHL